MKILFQGDSITDADRNRDDIHDLGNGYPKYAAKYLTDYFPAIDFEFIDLGISGNQTIDLVNRLESDFIDIQPDIVSILIGVNDTWHRAESREWLSDEEFENRYRTVLDAIKKETNAKIVMLEQFLLPAEDKLYFREDLDPKIQIVRKLAREYADLFIPLDGILAAACIKTDWRAFSEDGVHLTYSIGADFVGHIYADYVAEVIEEVCSQAE